MIILKKAKRDVSILSSPKNKTLCIKNLVSNFKIFKKDVKFDSVYSRSVSKYFDMLDTHNYLNYRCISLN